MKQLLQQIQQGDLKALARSISLVENEANGYEELLQHLPVNNSTKIIGITGPPGGGKSTLADALIGELLNDENQPAGQAGKIGVLCVDPSSPFNLGALLGDRIRMSEWYNNPNVFIRSLATRGSLGGLHPKIIEIVDIMKAAEFNYIIIETVGVGQSEVEIAGFADVTIVVLVPEGGDVIQTMKAGLMEIADIFVVNKSDRPDAEIFVNNLKMMLQPVFHRADVEIPVVKTVATEKKGLPKLRDHINKIIAREGVNHNRSFLLTEKAYLLIQQKRMQDIDKAELKSKIEAKGIGFNIYNFIKDYY